MSLNWFLYQKGVMVCVVYALPVAQTLGYSNHKEDNSGFITCSSALYTNLGFEDVVWGLSVLNAFLGGL